MEGMTVCPVIMSVKAITVTVKYHGYYQEREYVKCQKLCPFKHAISSCPSTPWVGRCICLQLFFYHFLGGGFSHSLALNEMKQMHSEISGKHHLKMYKVFVLSIHNVPQPVFFILYSFYYYPLFCILYSLCHTKRSIRDSTHLYIYQGLGNAIQRVNSLIYLLQSQSISNPYVFKRL